MSESGQPEGCRYRVTTDSLEINRLHFALRKGQVTLWTPSLARRDTRVHARFAKR